MKNIYRIISGLVALTAISCEELVESVDLPQVEPVLVVQSFISPQDSFILVSVSESMPVLGTVSSFEQVNYIDDATVTIYDGEGHSKVVPFSGISGKYALPATMFEVVAGQTYYLEVTDKQGRQVKSHCTVPAYANETLAITGFDTVGDGDFKDIYVKYQFTDTPGDQNYYRVAVNGTAIDESGTGLITFPISDYYEGQIYITDKNQDGKTFLFRQHIYEDYLVSVTFLLLHTDRHYYDYHKSVSGFIGDDPFSEPVLIYTNIEGGLGVFAAYNQFSLTQ